jgi:hypothetical protein
MDLLINYGIQSTLRQITETPTINFVSKSDSTIVFTITNTDLKLATIYWELDNPTPTLNSLILPEGTTSNEITVTGLSVGSLYTIYVRAKASAKLESSVASMTQTIESSELILYNAGNEFTNVTGGWFLEYSFGQFVNASKGPNSFIITTSWSGSSIGAVRFVVTNPIDLTPYSVMKVDMSSTSRFSSSTSYNRRIFVRDANLNTIAFSTDSDLTRKVSQLDISSLTGSYTLLVSYYGHAGQVFKVWLE